MTATLLPLDWALPLQSQGLTKPDLDSILARAYSAGVDTWPKSTDVFNAFKITPFSRVRVVVIGQDPYPSPANATGVAFSTGAGGDISDALSAIHRNLLATTPSFRPPPDGDLTAWADRGALLLNAALTIDDSSSLSVRCRLWRPVLRATLAALSATKRAIPVILLGGIAESLRVAIDDPDAVIIAGHPTPRNRLVKRFPLFEDARPFLDANSFLHKHGETDFDWTLA